jgi:hypothetical protein
MLLAGLLSATGLAPAGGQPLTWTVVASPSNPGNNSLDAVSCSSPTACMAVGFYYSSKVPESALAERWNGTAWSIVPTPSPLRRALYGVSCLSATDCIAVGASNLSSTTFSQLVETWNGTKWSVVSMVAMIGDELTGVSCPTSTSCTAVGDQSGAGGSTATFVMSWNGTSWSVVPSPSKGDGFATLAGVSCVTPADCTAAGFYNYSGLKPAPLIESWNGTAWSIVPAPNVGNGTTLTGISCPSASFCAAVGTFLGSSVNNRSVVESWNGTKWSAAPVPAGPSQLAGVSCASTTDCWAAGNIWNKAITEAHTYAEFWNGTRWSVVPTPNRGRPGAFDIFRAVSCGAASGCAAVGDYGAGGPFKSLTEIGSQG